MTYQVSGTCTLDGSPVQGVEIDVVSADGAQSLGRTTSAADGAYSVNVGSFSDDVLVSAYIDSPTALVPQVKLGAPTEASFSPDIYDLFYSNILSWDGSRSDLLGSDALVQNNYAAVFGSNTDTSDGLVTTGGALSRTQWTADDVNYLNFHWIGDTTICVRLQYNGGPTNSTIIANGGPDESSGANYNYLLQISGGATSLRWFMEYGSGSNSFYSAPFNFVIGEFYDITAKRTVSGSTCVIELFVNGVNIGTSSSILNSNGGEGSNSVLNFGASSGTSGESINSLIKGAVIAKRILTDEEIQSAFNNFGA